MSFADVETGSAPAAVINDPNATFLQLQNSLSMQVFKMNANIRGIKTLVDQLGTLRDTGFVRKSLHELAETTRDMARRGSEDVQKLAELQPSIVSSLCVQKLTATEPVVQPHHRTALVKTQRALQDSLVEFQKVQQLSAHRQRAVVEGVKFAVGNSAILYVSPSAADFAC